MGDTIVIPRQADNGWLATEIEYLESLPYKVNPHEVMKMLPRRTWSAIQQKHYRLTGAGLRSTEPKMSVKGTDKYEPNSSENAEKRDCGAVPSTTLDELKVMVA